MKRGKFSAEKNIQDWEAIEKAVGNPPSKEGVNVVFGQARESIEGIGNDDEYKLSNIELVGLRRIAEEKLNKNYFEHQRGQSEDSGDVLDEVVVAFLEEFYGIDLETFNKVAYKAKERAFMLKKIQAERHYDI